jgi:hypothetical protein
MKYLLSLNESKKVKDFKWSKFKNHIEECFFDLTDNSRAEIHICYGDDDYFEGYYWDEYGDCVLVIIPQSDVFLNPTSGRMQQLIDYKNSVKIVENNLEDIEVSILRIKDSYPQLQFKFEHMTDSIYLFFIRNENNM